MPKAVFWTAFGMNMIRFNYNRYSVDKLALLAPR